MIQILLTIYRHFYTLILACMEVGYHSYGDGEYGLCIAIIVLHCAVFLAIIISIIIAACWCRLKCTI